MVHGLGISPNRKKAKSDEHERNEMKHRAQEELNKPNMKRGKIMTTTEENAYFVKNGVTNWSKLDEYYVLVNPDRTESPCGELK